MTNPNGSKWIRKAKRQRIYARDSFRCVWRFEGCKQGERGTTLAKDLTLDHVLPREAGGSNHESNLVTACISCNSRRADRSAIEFCFATCDDPAAHLDRMLAAVLSPLPPALP